MTTQLVTHTLQEWEELVLPGVTLTTADRALAGKLGDAGGGRLLVEELRAGVRIRSFSWVGVACFEAFEVRIKPKLVGGESGVLRMLDATSGLEALKKQGGRPWIEPESTTLFDLIVRLLADACDRVVRGGLLTDYVQYEEELPVLRGRLLVDRQVLQRKGRLDRLWCRFDERDPNIPENQLLAAALLVARGKVRDARLSRHVRQLSAVFEAVTELSDLAFPQRVFEYNRLTEHYREPHFLAKLVLDGLGVHDLSKIGKTRCFAFLLDMNRLFELFVFKLIQLVVARTQWRVRYQARDRSLLWDVPASRPYGSVIPDLLLEGRGIDKHRLPVDAKYKSYDLKKISPADLYQGAIYAWAYAGTSHGIGVTTIVCPTAAEDAPVGTIEVRRGLERLGRIIVAPVHILRALDELERRCRGGECAKLASLLGIAAGRAA